ncbi:MAG: diguanylate cyclase [Candidatus Sumerlaeota bacterium]|nr:diguanylate cyclase [Candidatus Sumerlaeota bacterium]
MEFLSVEKSAQSEFEKLEFVYRLLDLLPAGVALISPVGRVVFWNRAAEQITGFTLMEVGGSACLRALHNPEKGYGAAALSPMHGRPKRIEIERKDGRKVTLVAQWAHLPSSSNDDYCIYAFADVTENVIDEDSVQIVNQLLFEAAQRMHSQANTDGLTGLLNHRAFHERLQQEVSRMRRHDRPLSVIMCDVDFFKRVNDTYGHLFGDRVLIALSETARVICRHEDVVGRYGGEEFVVILPDTPPEGAIITAERLRTAVEKHAVRDRDIVASVTISCGISCAYPKSGEETNEEIERRLVSQADEALYQAKGAGRNRTVAHKSARLGSEPPPPPRPPL